MRKSGQILRAAFDKAEAAIAPGVSTAELAAIVTEEVRSRGGETVLLGYQNFPDTVCISVNQQVVHGIPGKQVLEDGDLVSLDLCVGYKGMITDSAFTAVVGGLDKASSRVRTMLKATQESLWAGIDQVKAGAHVGDVSHAIEQRLRRDNLGVIEALVGHGVGHGVHEDPEVPNFGFKGQGPILKAGMTIAIEPMATLGGKQVYTEKDNWTISTSDQSLSAHFEHTVLVADGGCEVLTDN